MKSRELHPTQENLVQTLVQDSIGRNHDLFRFVELLNCIEDGCSIALDGRWGSGKTFFVKQSIMVLNSYNSTIQSDDDVSKLIADCVKTALKNVDMQPYVSVYYDAWINDNDVDPVLSMIYEILKSVDSDFKFTEAPSFFEVAGGIAEVITGKSVNAVLAALKSDDPFSALRYEKNLQAKINEFLESLLCECGNRLNIFVDELDRCKPSYAVQFLERVKHYFNNDRITFIFSVNSEQLAHTISCCYGEKFDSTKYLDRFFDLCLSLPPADMERYYQSIELHDNSFIFERACRIVIRYFNLTMREVEKFYRMAKIVSFRISHSNAVLWTGEENAQFFCLTYIVPVMIGLRMSDLSRYDSFLKGTEGEALISVLTDADISHKIFVTTTESGEEETPELIREKVDTIYRALFVQNYSRMGVENINIGNMQFNHRVRQHLLRAVSLLSDYSDFV